MLNEATVEHLKKFLTPLHAAIIHLEVDVPNLAEVFPLYSKVRIGMMENIETIPLIDGEQETIATILDTRENFCIKMIHKSAYFLDPRYHGELLSDENKLAAIQFVCEPAEKFSTSELLDVDSLKVQQDCILYAAKNGVFANSFLWKNVAKMSSVAWWNAYFSNQEITKMAIRILRLPATTAAVERSFSCYSNIHSAKRNRLSNDRAFKFVYVSLNLELLARTKRNHANKIIHTELEKINDNAQTYAATSIEVDCSSDEVSVIRYSCIPVMMSLISTVRILLTVTSK